MRFSKTKHRSLVFFLIRELASCLEQFIVGLSGVLYESLLQSNYIESIKVYKKSFSDPVEKPTLALHAAGKGTHR